MFKKTILLLLLTTAFICSNCKNKNNSRINILPSWNDTATKNTIIHFVNDVTDSKSKNFIKIEDRIAVFDNDGNLWSEKPMYFQLYFTIDRIKKLSKDNPEWKNKQPFKAVLEDDYETLKKHGEHGLLELVMASHSELSIENFDKIVKDWIKTAKHPTKQVSYDKLVYQPMLELINYLKANDFKIYIVSGGGVDFMRAFLPEIYNIPKEQFLGSSLKTSFNNTNGEATIHKEAKIDFINDKEGKPINIEKVIGKKPVLASGNSDGDLAMLQWTATNNMKNLLLLLHHTDAEREWAYDKKSAVGKLDKALEAAQQNNWTVIDMKVDWKTVYGTKN